MTEAEYFKYKSDFEVIKDLKDQIKNKEAYIRKLTAWDKNGSHKKAISEAMSQLGDTRKEFKKWLNGVEYNHMMLSLRKATVLYNKAQVKAQYIVKFKAFNPFGVKNVESEKKEQPLSQEPVVRVNKNAPKLILLSRVRPVVHEVHLGSISQANNLILTTEDKAFAERLVKGFNEVPTLNLLRGFIRANHLTAQWEKYLKENS
jgi:hypothetical protein